MGWQPKQNKVLPLIINDNYNYYMNSISIIPMGYQDIYKHQLYNMLDI